MKKKIIKFGIFSVWLNITGVVLSGLVFPVLSIALSPQPAWQNAEVFAGNFNFLQIGTFFSGFLLAAGFAVYFIALHLLAKKEDKLYSLTALVFISVFTSLIFLNYIIQTTLVPHLALNYVPEYGPILSSLTMCNPGSIGWALEMYGWAVLGLATIFIAMLFKKGGLEKTLKLFFILNGAGSIAAALVTSFNMKWVFTPAGLVSAALWNLLILVIDILLLKYLKQKRQI